MFKTLRKNYASLPILSSLLCSHICSNTSNQEASLKLQSASIARTAPSFPYAFIFLGCSANSLRQVKALSATPSFTSCQVMIQCLVSLARRLTLFSSRIRLCWIQGILSARQVKRRWYLSRHTQSKKEAGVTYTMPPRSQRPERMNSIPRRRVGEVNQREKRPKINEVMYQLASIISGEKTSSLRSKWRARAITSVSARYASFSLPWCFLFFQIQQSQLNYKRLIHYYFLLNSRSIFALLISPLNLLVTPVSCYLDFKFLKLALGVLCFEIPDLPVCFSGACIKFIISCFTFSGFSYIAQCPPSMNSYNLPTPLYSTL